MEINEIAEGLDRDNHPRDGLFVIEGLTGKLLKRLIGALAKLSQELSIKSEMGPEHLGDSKHILPVRQRIEDFSGNPLSKHEDPLLVAGWTKVAAFAGKGEKNLVLAVLAFNPSEAFS